MDQISIYEGHVGGGKTFSAIHGIIRHLASGRYVRTNVQLNIEPIRALLQKKYRWDLQPRQLELFDGGGTLKPLEKFPVAKVREDGTWDEQLTLIVIDEAHLFLPQHGYKSKELQEWGDYLSHVRKYGHKYVFITQDAALLYNACRRQATQFVHFRDMNKLTILGIRSPSQSIRQLYYMPSNLRDPIETTYIPKDKRIFGCYNSASLIFDAYKPPANAHICDVISEEQGKDTP